MFVYTAGWGPRSDAANQPLPHQRQRRPDERIGLYPGAGGQPQFKFNASVTRPCWMTTIAEQIRSKPPAELNFFLFRTNRLLEN